MTFADWCQVGRPVSSEGIPHLARAAILRALAGAYGLSVFVETGTAMGAMLEVLLDDFEHLFSVELDRAYYDYAASHVGKSEKVSLSLGHSPKFLSYLMGRLFTPCLVFLDAHYSGPNTGRGPSDTPVEDELGILLNAPVRHLIVIDDARGFGVWPDYPDLDGVRNLACRHGYQMSVYADQIELNPGSS